MGNFVQHISDRVSIIASRRLWLEDAAIQQLTTTAALAGMQRVVGLPDLHPGRGYPVGAAFFSTGQFYPALVGNDIGCGMALWQTDLVASKVKLDKLDQRLGNLDRAPDTDEWETLVRREPSLADAIQQLGEELRRADLDLTHLGSLGTIGGGNHFAELQVIDQVQDAAGVAARGLVPARLQLLVHSGSRGLGQAVLRSHVDAFGHAGLTENTEAARAYLAQHAVAVKFAELNRRVIAERIFLRLRCDATPGAGREPQHGAGKPYRWRRWLAASQGRHASGRWPGDAAGLARRAQLFAGTCGAGRRTQSAFAGARGGTQMAAHRLQGAPVQTGDARAIAPHVAGWARNLPGPRIDL